jgi:hypothetical protein
MEERWYVASRVGFGTKRPVPAWRTASFSRSEVRNRIPRQGERVRWGGWGSNPRPADYDKHGPDALYALTAQMTRIIALTALAALGLTADPVHARGPCADSFCYCA